MGHAPAGRHGGHMSGSNLQNLAFFLLLALILYVGTLGAA